MNRREALHVMTWQRGLLADCVKASTAGAARERAPPYAGGEHEAAAFIHVMVLQSVVRYAL
jgi:hypothetical protein